MEDRPMTERPAPRRRRRAWLLLLLVILLLGWWLWPDGRLARARALQRELFAESAKGLPPDQRRAKFQEFRTTTAALSAGQRRELSQDMMKRRLADLQNYAKMSPKQKRDHLDGLINRM